MKIIDTIIATWNSFWVSILDLVQKVFSSLWLMLKDFFIFIIDQLLSLSETILGSVDLSDITQHFGIFQQIPESLLNILGLVGFAQCMVIIGAAIIVRILLQLIPFVRLGS